LTHASMAQNFAMAKTQAGFTQANLSQAKKQSSVGDDS